MVQAGVNLTKNSGPPFIRPVTQDWQSASGDRIIRAWHIMREAMGPVGRPANKWNRTKHAFWRHSRKNPVNRAAESIRSRDTITERNSSATGRGSFIRARFVDWNIRRRFFLTAPATIYGRG